MPTKFRRARKKNPKPSKPGGLALKDVIKAGYNSPNADKNIADQGYVLDNDLSNDNEKVYFHPNDRKLVVNVVGTHNASDVLTDTSMLFGGLKYTRRYNNAVKTVHQAKEKYKPVHTTLTGHSLGGAIVSRMPDEEHTSKVTYNKASMLEDVLGGTSGKNETHYRTANDLPSLWSAMAPNTKTIKATTLNPLETHKSDALGDEPVFV